MNRSSFQENIMINILHCNIALFVKIILSLVKTEAMSLSLQVPHVECILVAVCERRFHRRWVRHCYYFSITIAHHQAHVPRLDKVIPMHFCVVHWLEFASTDVNFVATAVANTLASCSSMQSECVVYSSEKGSHMTWLPTKQMNSYHELQLAIAVIADVNLHLFHTYCLNYHSTY